MQVDGDAGTNVVDLTREEVEDINSAVDTSIAGVDKSDDDKDDKSDDDDAQGELDGDKVEEEDEGIESEDDNGVSEEDDGHETDDDEVSDEMLEKAIALGVPIAEARKLGSELLHGRIAGLEKSNSDQGENSADSESPSNDLLEGIPDLDPDVYDEGLVEGFKAMKQVIRDQSATIKGMSKASAGDRLVSQLVGDAAKALEANPAKGAELKEKVDILTAGYKSIGKEVSGGDILEEAVGSVLGDDIAKVAASANSAKAKKRSAQKISRSAGSRDTESKDVFGEMGDELDRKFFNKK